MRKTGEEKAITLIALIITIVVLLILAVVAINSVTGDGIIQYAVNAKTEYEEAQDEENETLSYYESFLNVKGQVGKWIQTGKTVERINSNGVKEQLPAIEKVNVDGSSQILAIGDYVGYTTGVEGYTDEKGWQVLGVDNGKILLVSTKSVGTCELKGKNAIENCKTRLDAVCLPYLNEELASTARSVMAEDVNKITGYNPEEEIGDQEKIDEYGNEIKYIKSGSSILYEAIEGNNFSGETGYSTFEYLNGEEWEVLDKEGEDVTLKSTAYIYYLNDIGIEAGSILYNMLTLPETSYWFATTSFAHGTKGGEYHIKFMGKLAAIGNIWIYACNGEENTLSTNVRAVITLKEDKDLKWNEKTQVWDIE